MLYCWKTTKPLLNSKQPSIWQTRSPGVSKERLWHMGQKSVATWILWDYDCLCVHDVRAKWAQDGHKSNSLVTEFCLPHLKLSQYLWTLTQREELIRSILTSWMKKSNQQDADVWSETSSKLMSKVIKSQENVIFIFELSVAIPLEFHWWHYTLC